MKQIKYTIALAILVSLIQGCYKDKGNYDYQAVADVKIDTANLGILPSYAIYRYDTLKIAPKVYYHDTLITDEKAVADRLSFTWVIFQGTVGSEISTRDTLSNIIALNKPITKPGGKWIVHLTVKELSTQVETYVRFTVEVAEVISDGWMVLYEKNGNTDVGLIVDDRIKKGVTSSRLFLDLVKSSNGASLAGKPVGVVHSVAPLTTAEILVASEKDFVAVDKSSFEITYTFEDLFWDPPVEKALTAMVGNYQRKEMIINNGKLNTVSYSAAGTYRSNNKMGPAITGNYGELEKWAATFYGSSYDAVVYDKTNKKFMYVVSGGTTVADFPAQSTSMQFSPSSVGLDLRATDWGLSNYEYSIMGNSTSNYLLISNFTAATNSIGTKKIDMSACPEAAAATTLSAGYAGQYLLYGANANVYLYKYNAGTAAELAWTAPAGEAVTCVRLQKFYYPTFQTAIMPNPHKVVYIATWNETTQTGKVYSYSIDASNGGIDKTSERVTTGYGKVKDMGYKWSI